MADAAASKDLTTGTEAREIGGRWQRRRGLGALLMRPEAGAVLATIVVFVFFSLFAPNFLTERVLSNVLLLAAELGILAVGVTMLMIAGEFDLSVGSVFGLGAGIVIVTLNAGIPALPAIALALLIAAGIGALNGVMVTRLRIHSLIVTLGGLMFYRAIVLAITGGFPLRLTEEHALLSLFSFRVRDVPGSFFWFLLMVIIFAIILNSTKKGNWTFATGGDPESAREMGVPINRVKITTFMLASVLAAFAGIVQMSRFSTIDALRGDGMELEAVLAVVVGGASLRGGYGSIVGAALGVIMLAMIKQGLILMGIPAFWFRAGVGVVLIGAAVINQYTLERSQR